MNTKTGFVCPRKDLKPDRVPAWLVQQGEAPQIFATLSRWDTPYAALWAQSVPAIALILLPGAGLGTLTTFREYVTSGSSETEPRVFEKRPGSKRF
jgi:hypothetical protein